jgi:hypothetical protein
MREEPSSDRILARWNRIEKKAAELISIDTPLSAITVD